GRLFGEILVDVGAGGPERLAEGDVVPQPAVAALRPGRGEHLVFHEINDGFALGVTRPGGVLGLPFVRPGPLGLFLVFLGRPPLGAGPGGPGPLPSRCRGCRRPGTGESRPPPAPAPYSAGRTSAPGSRPTAARPAPARLPGTAARPAPARWPSRTAATDPS